MGDPSAPPPDEDFEAAIAIAGRIADEAVWCGEACGFHGAAAPPALGQPVVHRSLGGDVYEGSAGIARFLGLASQLTGDERLRRTALGAARHALRQAEGWSLFSGGIGIGVAVLDVAERTGELSIVPPAVAAVEAASERALAGGAAAGPYDFLLGQAGVIHGLVAGLAYDVDGGWRSRAFDLGRSLLAAALDDGAGWSWPAHPDLPERLCGLAHGASGVALALQALARLAPAEPGWAASAAKARAFERAWYSPEQGSWADLRSELREQTGGTPVYPHMWCHGSVGVGAERLAMAGGQDRLAHADAVAALAGAEAEARRILAGPAGAGAGDGANASQCHGLSGMIELFLDAAARDGDPRWHRLARAAAAFMRDDARRAGGWRCGLPGGWWTPGLMLGGAGIGWALLRVWNPAAIGSCWRLELNYDEAAG